MLDTEKNEFSDLALKISQSPFCDLFLFLLESHLPLKNLLLFSVDFTAPYLHLFSKSDGEKLRTLLAEPDKLNDLINYVREIKDDR